MVTSVLRFQTITGPRISSLNGIDRRHDTLPWKQRRIGGIDGAISGCAGSLRIHCDLQISRGAEVHASEGGFAAEHGVHEAAVDGEFVDFPGPFHVAAGGGVIHFEFDYFGSVGDGGSGCIREAALEGEEFGVSLSAGEQEGGEGSQEGSGGSGDDVGEG